MGHAVGDDFGGLLIPQAAMRSASQLTTPNGTPGCTLYPWFVAGKPANFDSRVNAWDREYQ